MGQNTKRKNKGNSTSRTHNEKNRQTLVTLVWTYSKDAPRKINKENT